MQNNVEMLKINLSFDNNIIVVYNNHEVSQVIHLSSVLFKSSGLNIFCTAAVCFTHFKKIAYFVIGTHTMIFTALIEP